MKNPLENVRILWPIPPDKPRLEHIGNIQTEKDFPKSTSHLEKWLQVVTGDINSESAIINPHGILVDNNIAYVSDPAQHNIIVFNFEKRSISPLLNNGHKGGILDTPLGLAMDSKGHLFVADAGKKSILGFASDGRLLFTIGDENRLQRPTDIAFDSKADRLYISDSVAHRIFVYDLKGNYLFDIGGKGDAPGNFIKPSGLAFDLRNRLYVADTGNARIQVFDADGNFIEAIGSRGNTVHYLSKPVDVAFDREEHLYVLDQDFFALLTYSPDGEVLLATGTGSASKGRLGLNQPTSIFIDDNDRIFITDKRNHRFNVWQFLNNEYLTDNPVTEEDISKLKAYMTKRQNDQKANKPPRQSKLVNN